MITLRSLSSDQLGYYIPAFFFMHVKTKSPLTNLNQLDNATLSTVAHEYFHFLQDILTTYGLLDIVTTVDRLKRANQEIQNSSEDSFGVPYIPPLDGLTQLNADLLSIYKGDGRCNISFNRIKNVRREANGLIPNYEHVPSIIVEVENTYTQQESSFYLGQICIAENMAYLLEDELFGNVKVPKFPYRIVENICDYIYPYITQNRLNIIALCEVALNHSHPALILIDLLQKMQENNYMPKNPRHIYTLAAHYNIYENGLPFTMGDLFDKYSNIAQKSLTDYFTDPIYEPAKKWIEATFLKARQIRQENKFTFLDFAEDKREGIRNLQRMINEIGTPLMSNSENVFYCLHPQTNSESQAPLFKAINEVHNVLFGFQAGCSLKEYCQHNLAYDPTSHLCDESPWEHSFKEQLCSFAQIWKMWGLNNKKVTKNHI